MLHIRAKLAGLSIVTISKPSATRQDPLRTDPVSTFQMYGRFVCLTKNSNSGDFRSRK